MGFFEISRLCEPRKDLTEEEPYTANVREDIANILLSW